MLSLGRGEPFIYLFIWISAPRERVSFLARSTVIPTGHLAANSRVDKTDVFSVSAGRGKVLVTGYLKGVEWSSLQLNTMT